MEDYVEVAVDRHVHKAEKLWQWKLKLERVRLYIERAMNIRWMSSGGEVEG
jgi:hypothetical protein